MTTSPSNMWLRATSSIESVTVAEVARPGLAPHVRDADVGLGQPLAREPKRAQHGPGRRQPGDGRASQRRAAVLSHGFPPRHSVAFEPESLYGSGSSSARGRTARVAICAVAGHEPRIAGAGWPTAEHSTLLTSPDDPGDLSYGEVGRLHAGGVGAAVARKSSGSPLTTMVARRWLERHSAYPRMATVTTPTTTRKAMLSA
jgi:hypothetical protein